MQVGHEIAIAIENALAYQQIADLTERLAREKRVDVLERPSRLRAADTVLVLERVERQEVDQQEARRTGRDEVERRLAQRDRLIEEGEWDE